MIERTIVVAVGVGHYRTAIAPDLPTAPLDAVRVALAWQKLGVPANHTYVFVQASGGQNGDRRLDDLLAQLHPGTNVKHEATQVILDTFFRDTLPSLGGSDGRQLFLYWCGHGFTDARTGVPYLLCAEWSERLSNRLIDRVDLLDRLHSDTYAAFRSQLVILDACAMDRPGSAVPLRQADAPWNAAIDQVSISSAARGQHAHADDHAGRFTALFLQVLAACTGWPRLDEFTEALQSALKAADYAWTSVRYRRGQGDEDEWTRPGLDRTRPRISLAPGVPAAFVPRQEADALAARLVAPGSAAGVTPLAIHGHAGVGKTLLAADVADREDIRARFSDVPWATLGQSPDRLSLLISWIHALGERTYVPVSEAAATSLLRTLLASRRVLLVIDDAWTSEDARPFLVGGRECGVLMTMRRANVGDELGAEVTDLHVFSREEAMRFLTRRLRTTAAAAPDTLTLKALADAVGCHPMALDLLAAMLNRGFDSRLALHRLTVTHDDPSLPTEVHRCIHLSLEWLRKRDPSSWKGHAGLGVLVEDAHIDSRLAARLWGVERLEAEKRLSLLADDALLQRRPGYYVMHDLVRDVAAWVVHSPAGLGVEPAAAHVNFLRAYGDALTTGDWHRVEPDGYIHENLGRHLIRAGREDLLHALFEKTARDGGNSWYAFHRRRGSLGSFLDDVSFALEACRQSAPDRIGRQLRYVLMHSTFESLFSNISPRVPALLVSRGLWSVEWAADLALRLTPERSRLHAIAYLTHAATSDDGGPVSHGTAVHALTEALIGAVRGWSQGDYHSALLVSACLHRVPEPAASVLLKAIVEIIPTGDGKREQGFNMVPEEAVRIAAATRGAFRDRLIDVAVGQAFRLQIDYAVRAMNRVLPACTPEQANRIAREFFKRFDLSPSALTDEVKEEPSREEPSREAVDTPPVRPTDRGMPPVPASAGALILRPEQETEEEPKDPEAADSGEPFDIEEFMRKYGPAQSGASRHSRESLDNAASALEMIAEWPCHLPEEAWFHVLEQQAGFAAEGLRNARRRALERPRPQPNVSASVRGAISGFGSYLALKDAEHLSDLFRLCEPANARDLARAALEKAAEQTSLYYRQLAGPLRLMGMLDVAEASVFVGKLMSVFGEEDALLQVVAAASKRDDDALAARIEQVDAIQDADEFRLVLEWACQYGSADVVDKALANSRIRDGLEQTAAVMNMAPYVRVELLAGALPRLGGRVGRQSETLTRLVRELSAQIRGDALVAFVEDASRFQSEWWIAEALDILAWHRHAVADLQGIVRAGNHLRAIDLRARVSERVCGRLVALGEYEAAIAVAEAITLDLERWRVMANVSSAASAMGHFDQAGEFASRIDERHERSRALRELAFGLARHGRMAEAKAIEIPEAGERDWVARCLAAADNGSSHVPGVPRPPMLHTEPSVDLWRRHQLRAIENVVTRGEGWRALDGLRVSVKEAREVTDMAAAAWNSPLDTGQAFYAALCHRRRKDVLALMRDLAPVLAWNRGDDADEMLRAIGDVCAWWQ